MQPATTMHLDHTLARGHAHARRHEDGRWPLRTTVLFVCGASVGLWGAIAYLVSLAF
jgi:hypothetical protein